MLLTLTGAAAFALLMIGLAGAAWGFVRSRWRWAGTMLAVAAGLAALPGVALAGYLGWRVLAGQPSPAARQLGPGAHYTRHVLRSPNRAVVHVVRIDDPARRRFQLTSPEPTPDGLRNAAGFADEAATTMQADVLINASYFTPFYDNWFFDAYPRPGDLVEPIGTVVIGGEAYGKPKPNWTPFWIDAAGRPGFGPVPKDAGQAVTGRQWLLRDGMNTAEAGGEPYPRTAIAMDATRERLWLVVVDGKQPRYSDGLTYQDLAAFLQGLGASDAVEMDGGGSSILVARDAAGLPEVLSRPCHTKIPGRQRPVGVFLGVILDPKRAGD